MSEHELCAEQTAKTNLVHEAQLIVRFAATPVEPGESIGAQILKASKELGLPHAIVWRAWYGRSGPEIFITIYAAYCKLIERRAHLIAAARAAQTPFPSILHSDIGRMVAARLKARPSS